MPLLSSAQQKIEFYCLNFGKVHLLLLTYQSETLANSLLFYFNCDLFHIKHSIQSRIITTPAGVLVDIKQSCTR